MLEPVSIVIDNLKKIEIEKFSLAEDICELPHTRPLYNLAQGNHFRFWHNKDTRQCERFVYEGCVETANSFKTYDECEKACPYA